MKLNLAGVAVMLVMPTNRDLPVQTVTSLLETAKLLRDRHIPFDIQIEYGCSIVESARSCGAHHFLRSECNRLFWVDSDIAWKPEDFLQLVALSTVMPVVGATYSTKQDPPEYRLNVPTHEDVEANEWGCLPVWGMGLGFTIVQREVIEKLAEKAPVMTFPWEPETPVAHIFRCGSVESDRSKKLGCLDFMGEDMAFFTDVRALGYPVHLCIDINLKHIGPKAYGGNFANCLKKSEKLDGTT